MAKTVYDCEEKLGLRFVANLVVEDGYEGEHFAVWLAKGGQVYYGSAGHCSCNEPFDNVSALSDLYPAKDFNEVWRAVNHWRDSGMAGRLKSDEVEAFREKVLERIALAPLEVVVDSVEEEQ